MFHSLWWINISKGVLLKLDLKSFLPPNAESQSEQVIFHKPLLSRRHSRAFLGYGTNQILHQCKMVFHMSTTKPGWQNGVSTPRATEGQTCTFLTPTLTKSRLLEDRSKPSKPEKSSTTEPAPLHLLANMSWGLHHWHPKHGAWTTSAPACSTTGCWGAFDHHFIVCTSVLNAALLHTSIPDQPIAMQMATLTFH